MTSVSKQTNTQKGVSNSIREVGSLETKTDRVSDYDFMEEEKNFFETRSVSSPRERSLDSTPVNTPDSFPSNAQPQKLFSTLLVRQNKSTQIIARLRKIWSIPRFQI